MYSQEVINAFAAGLSIGIGVSAGVAVLLWAAFQAGMDRR